jgi:hypothetical protein
MSWLGLGVDTYSNYPRKITKETIAQYGDDLGPPPTIYDESIDAEPAGYDASRAPTDVPQSVLDMATAMFYRPAATSTLPKPTYGPAPPPDQAVVQRAVAQANARTSTSTSAHAQVAKIRAAQAAARNARRRTGAGGGAMTPEQQRQIILATQARSGGLGAGAKIALGVLGGLALLSIGAALFGGRRTRR